MRRVPFLTDPAPRPKLWSEMVPTVAPQTAREPQVPAAMPRAVESHGAPLGLEAIVSWGISEKASEQLRSRQPQTQMSLQGRQDLAKHITYRRCPLSHRDIRCQAHCQGQAWEHEPHSTAPKQPAPGQAPQAEATARAHPGLGTLGAAQ